MIRTKTGGPAFPNNLTPGMDLRDYFAAKALPAAMHEASALYVKGPTPEYVAELCYSIADAMLAERAKGGGA
jgi:hypothetical protein